MRTLNHKWTVLSEKLRQGGLSEEWAAPRFVARAYFSGRAVLRETQEEEGQRTIYAIAYWWSDENGPYPPWIWTDKDHPVVIDFGWVTIQNQLLEELRQLNKGSKSGAY